MSKRSLKPVTTAIQAKGGIIGGKFLQLVDTPGFLDPSSATKEDELEELAKGILSFPNGIHALGLVIDINGRITAPVEVILTQLLDFVELVPYAFVIFSHAKELAETDKDQKVIVKEMLDDESGCPKILSRVLECVNGRYIVLESVKDMAQGYHDIKVTELTQIVNSILAIKKKPFTCFLTDVAKRLQEDKVDLEERIRAASKDLRQLQNQLRIEKQKESQLTKEKQEITARSFWEKWSIHIATGMGATIGAAAGAVLGPAGSAAGATAGISYVATLVGGGAAVGGVAGGGFGAAVNNLCIIQ